MYSTKDHVDFIKNPNDWPNWPFLPMKRRSTDGIWDKMETGIIHAGDLTKVVVGLNIFAGWDKERYDLAEKQQYATVEALVNDGWEVD